VRFVEGNSVYLYVPFEAVVNTTVLFPMKLSLPEVGIDALDEPVDLEEKVST
jgi:hypothetical protein